MYSVNVNLPKENDVHSRIEDSEGSPIYETEKSKWVDLESTNKPGLRSLSSQRIKNEFGGFDLNPVNNPRRLVFLSQCR